MKEHGSVYGTDDSRWLLARNYLLNEAPDALFRFYAKHGPHLGRLAQSSPAARERLRPFADYLVAKGIALQGV